MTSVTERSRMDTIEYDGEEDIADYILYDPPQAGPGDDPRPAIWFNVSHVLIDHTVQRNTLPGRVETLNATWDFNKAESITITVREDDTLVVTEGQTRVLSRRATHPGSHMWGVVSTDSNEAKVALGIARGRKPLTPSDRWRLRKTDRDPRVLAAEDVMARMDPPLAILDRVGKSGYGIAAVNAVDRVMGTYSDDVPASAMLLRTILRTLTNAWDNPLEQRRLDGRLIEALRHLIHKNAEIIDTDRLLEAMKTMTPRRWYQFGDTKSSADTVVSAVGKEIAEVYNRNKKTRRIAW